MPKPTVRSRKKVPESAPKSPVTPPFAARLARVFGKKELAICGARLIRAERDERTGSLPGCGQPTLPYFWRSLRDAGQACTGETAALQTRVSAPRPEQRLDGAN